MLRVYYRVPLSILRRRPLGQRYLSPGSSSLRRKIMEEGLEDDRAAEVRRVAEMRRLADFEWKINRLRRNDEALNFNFSGLNMTEVQAGDLVGAINQNSNMKGVNVMECFVRSTGSLWVHSFLDKILAVHPSLTEVGLNYNRFSASHAASIARALKKNPRLKTISLKTNDFGPEGAKEIASFLKGDSSLEKLTFSENRLGDEGAIAIAQALEVNKSLTRVDLGGNGIRNDGAKELAEALKKNENIIVLNLSRNEIGDKGAKALANALKHNASLCHLFLDFDRLTAGGAIVFEQVLKHYNYQLERIHTSSGSAGISRIQELCTENRRLKGVFGHLKAEINQGGRTAAEMMPLALWPLALESIQSKPDYLYQALKLKLVALVGPNRRKRKRPP